VLVSGPKRDIALVARVDATAGDLVTVLDVSFAVNREAVLALLERGASVRYFDHHHAGIIPAHPRLCAHIDPSPSVCTAMLVDRALEGAHRAWAVVAAFGDNLTGPALALARSLPISTRNVERLRELGETLNYNGYGDDADDLIVAPVALYRSLARYADPLAFVAAEPVFGELAARRREDLDRAGACEPTAVLAGATVYVLPDAAWSRRVRGTFANDLANRLPDLAHAVLTPNKRGGYTVSIRTWGCGADAFCLAFPSGGGRAAAAGINDLPTDRLPDFLRRFDAAFPGRVRPGSVDARQRGTATGGDNELAAKEVIMRRQQLRHRHRPRAHHAARIVVDDHPKPVPILDEGREAPTSEQPFLEGADDQLGPELRHRLVSETAYRRLAERGFAEGYEGDDWLEAEGEVDQVVVKPETER
jgi:hypothetical protein